MDGSGQTLTHAGGTAQGAVQSGQVDHLDDGRHAATLLPDQPGDRTVVFDLAGGVGMVAELVLQPLNEHPVAGAVGQHPGQEEATEPARRLGQDQEHVAVGRGGEPLVPGEGVAAVGVGQRRSGAGPDVGSALLLGHRHTGGDAHLGGGHLQLGVIAAAGQQRLVNRGQFGVVPQRRDDGVGHRDRADVARLRGPDAHLGRAHHMGAGTVVGPRGGVQSVGDGRAHQLVIGRVVLDLVDAVAVAVVGV